MTKPLSQHRYPAAKVRVAAGIKYLDQHGPSDWRDRITQTLSMGNPCGCVIAQIYGTTYWAGLEELFPNSPDHEFGTIGFSAKERGMELGMNICAFNPSETYDQLAQEWIDQAGLKVDRHRYYWIA